MDAEIAVVVYFPANKEVGPTGYDPVLLPYTYCNPKSKHKFSVANILAPAVAMYLSAPGVSGLYHAASTGVLSYAKPKRKVEYLHAAYSPPTRTAKLFL